MRLCLGGGYLHTSATYLGRTQTISGGGMAMNLAFGGVVARNLAIFGEMSVSSAFDPTVDIDGQTYSANDTNVNLMNFGPGVAYYVESINLYLSGAVTLSRVYADDSQSSSSSSNVDLTDTGVGGSFMVGKEWWVSDNWGLGGALMLHLASMKMKDIDARMSAASVSFLFSATYN
jgi:hypothetical protein